MFQRRGLTAVLRGETAAAIKTRIKIFCSRAPLPGQSPKGGLNQASTQAVRNIIPINQRARPATLPLESMALIYMGLDCINRFGIG